LVGKDNESARLASAVEIPVEIACPVSQIPGIISLKFVTG
jgi:hypothetical protein